MRKLSRMIFSAMMLGIFMGHLISCEKEIEEFDPSKNTTDIAVSGLVEECGMTFAVINGYVNLNLLHIGSGSPIFGIEFGEKGTEGYQEATSTLVGNKISVPFYNLTPNKTYSYRTFVNNDGITHYGNLSEFSTKGLTNITTKGKVSDITTNSACVTFEVKESFFAEKDSWFVGVAYSLDKDKLHPDSTNSEAFEYIQYSENNPNNCDCKLVLENLIENRNYYYTTFTKANGVVIFSDIQSFITQEAGAEKPTYVGKKLASVGSVTLHYDEKGRLIKYIYDDGDYITFEYGKEDVLGCSPWSSYGLKAILNPNGLATSIESWHLGLGDGCDSSEHPHSTNDGYRFEYDIQGHLIKIGDYKVGDYYNLKWDLNGNLTALIHYDEEDTSTLTFEYGSSPIKNKMGFMLSYEVIWGIDLDEYDDFTVARVLGTGSKHLPISRSDGVTFKWTLDKEGYPISLKMTQNGESEIISLTWE